ncbi:MAG: ribonuclease Z [Lachnospiraceae bacterium]|nr:ribonuclease Z [Lachnospiraceae bacterium]
MIDVCLLGSGGMMPLPRRHLTSLMIRHNGSSLLIDCGEGTQIAIRKKGWSFKDIDCILLTHFHADHIAGLPGLFLTMGNADRTEPVTVIGPKGVERVIAAVRVIAPELPFEINCLAIEQQEESFQVKELVVNAYHVFHRIPCYGYSIELPRAGRFDAARAKAQEIPLKFWSRLQKGETIEDEGRVYTPDMVLGETRRGLKITYNTDTRPTDLIARYAEGSDLFICEGMYGEADKVENARKYRHMTMQEAAVLGRDCHVKEMWLTHYSPSCARPDFFEDEIRAIFPETVMARDGQSAELNFDEE